MKKQLQKPAHWQDFEDLCKELWGDLLNIPLKIKKNGRAGQSQDGVDIYGIPKGESNYWGIQCKGKSSYTSSQLTTKEIDIEVERARNFKPALEVFVIASTCNKDVNIEEYVRLLNKNQSVENQFEILLYCWEDISDEILKRKNVLDFYLNSSGSSRGYDITILINGSDSDTIDLKPQYKRGLKIDELETAVQHNPRFSTNNVFPLLGDYNAGIKKNNLACCPFDIKIVNTANFAIDDWKLIINFGNNFKYLDIINSGRKKELFHLLKSPLEIEKNKLMYNDEKSLIPKDSRLINLWITPFESEYTEDIYWTFLARDFNIEGKFKLNVVPNYEEVNLINKVKYSYEIKAPVPYCKEKISYD